MERHAAEALKAQRDQAVKAALKAKVPLFEIQEDFGLSEAEVGEIIRQQGSFSSRKPDDIIDARDEARIKAIERR